jgi:[ribosomal protein S5]-alanine N-acetyltransferase
MQEFSDLSNGKTKSKRRVSKKVVAQQPIILETERLFIRPLTYGQLVKYINWDHTLEEELGIEKSMSTISANLKEALAETILPKVGDESKNYLFCTLWTGISKAENQMIGDVCIVDEPSGKGEIEIGYGTFEEFRNRGLMTELVAGVIQWCKTQLKVKTILASTQQANLASAKVLQKNGFVLIGENGTILNWKLVLVKKS